VKRKDFRGPKPAAKGRMIKASTGAALDSKAKTFKPIANEKANISESEMQVRSGREKARKVKRKLKNIGNQIKGFGKEIIGKKVGGMTAGSRSALGRIQKANMVEARMGKAVDYQNYLKGLKKATTKPNKTSKRRVKFLNDEITSLGNPKKKGDPFLERRFKLSGVKKILPKRVKAIVSLLGAAAAGAAGQKALDKKRKKKELKELKGDVKGSIAPYKVDKKKMGGLKAELNNPAKGYMAGGMADYYKDLM
jgi:hypothetical protein